MIHHRPQALDPDVTRRSLLIRSVVNDRGLMLSLTLPVGPVASVGNLGFRPNAFIRIDSDGEVFLTWPYFEGGQDSRTLIPLLIAEGLDVAPNQVHLEQVVPSERSSSNPTLDAWAAGNSNAICNVWKPLREASAAARAMLIAAAARRWDADARLCHTYEGEVIHTTTWRKLRYGELAAEAARIPIPRNVALKQPAATPLRQA